MCGVSSSEGGCSVGCECISDGHVVRRWMPLDCVAECTVWRRVVAVCESVLYGGSDVASSVSVGAGDGAGVVVVGRRESLCFVMV
jgi:hypothetical protein